MTPHQINSDPGRTFHWPERGEISVAVDKRWWIFMGGSTPSLLPIYLCSSFFFPFFMIGGRCGQN